MFPYDWFDSIEKLEETKLPHIQEFYSKLNDGNITEEDYEHAQNVWKKFNIKNMREYHDLYLKTDVLLLADVFENFRKVCKENYKLDPTWYYTSPGLAWDAMLKMTKIELELLSDPQMYLMIENGIRGGVSHNDYPLAPERSKVGTVEKLIPNFNNKEKYVLHNEKLKLY